MFGAFMLKSTIFNDKLYYNLILIPVLKKSTLSVEQQLQFEKIKNSSTIKEILRK